jgi:hypothetical protein
LFKWLGKTIGEPATPAPAGVPAPWLFRLENLLVLVDGCTERLRDGLTQDMVQYVLHGAPEAVLHEVAQLGMVVGQLRLLRRYVHGEKIEHDIYEHFEDLPIEAALRYARLLEAFGPPHALLCMPVAARPALAGGADGARRPLPDRWLRQPSTQADRAVGQAA